MRLLRHLLWPFGLLWMLILRIRHGLYDAGILSSRKGAIPTLVVGNLELGGTGKSQLVLRLIDLLKNDLKIAVLSRGYGRKTTGFVEVHADSDSSEVGDEPLMFKRKFSEVNVFCDEDRVHGIDQIKAKFPGTQLVILDDAFQHRKLQPDMSLLVTDSGNPYWKNFIVPVGTLRDIKGRAKSASRLVVIDHGSGKAQAPSGMKSSAARVEIDKTRPLGGESEIPEQFFLLSGIAKPERFEKLASTVTKVIDVEVFADHHEFLSENMWTVRSKLNRFEASNTGILTTEKDAARLTEERIKELSPFKVFVLSTVLKLEDEQAITQEILQNVLERD